MRVLTRWADAVRAREWDATKAALVLLPLAASAGGVAPLTWAATAVFAAGFSATAYLVNDFSDRACDVTAGKRRPVHRWTPAAGWAVAGAHLAASLAGAALLPVRSVPLYAAGLALSYASAFAYSLPPLRLKERGTWGLVVAAAGQRVFPMMVAASASDAEPIVLALILTLAFLQGLRWILIHQVLDEAADRRSRVDTWTTLRGGATARTLLVRAVVPAEALGAALLVGALAPRAPAVAITLAAWLLALPAWYARLRARGEPLDWASYARAPGANFLLLVLPASLLLARVEIAGIALFLLFSGRHLAWQARDLAAVLAGPRTVAP